MRLNIVNIVKELCGSRANLTMLRRVNLPQLKEESRQRCSRPRVT